MVSELNKVYILNHPWGGERKESPSRDVLLILNHPWGGELLAWWMSFWRIILNHPWGGERPSAMSDLQQ